MKRTQLLQENRKMRFMEVYGDWNAGRLAHHVGVPNLHTMTESGVTPDGSMAVEQSATGLISVASLEYHVKS